LKTNAEKGPLGRDRRRRPMPGGKEKVLLDGLFRNVHYGKGKLGLNLLRKNLKKRDREKKKGV